MKIVRLGYTHHGAEWCLINLMGQDFILHDLYGICGVLAVEIAGAKAKMSPPGGAGVLPLSTSHSVKRGCIDVSKQHSARRPFPEG